MKISTMYLLMALSYFTLGIPLNAIVLYFAHEELKKEHTKTERTLIEIAQIVSFMLVLGMIVYLL